MLNWRPQFSFQMQILHHRCSKYIRDYQMITASQSAFSATKKTIQLGIKAKRFISGNSEFIYGENFSEIFYRPPGDRFYEVSQVEYFGHERLHRLMFEYVKDGQSIRHRLWRQGDLVVIDGHKVARKKYQFMSNEDIRKPCIAAYGNDFILDSAAVASLGLSAQDVIENSVGNIRRIDSELVMGGMELTYLKPPDSVTFQPLPEYRVPVFLFRRSDGGLIYVSGDNYHFSLSTSKIFAGVDNLSEIAVKSVESSGSSKTSYICKDLESSVLSIDQESSYYSFRGENLERLDIRNYDFFEIAGFAQVTPKSVCSETSSCSLEV